MNFISGDNYDGDWIAGKCNGNGVYTYKNGSIYKGEFKNDQFEGKG